MTGLQIALASGTLIGLALALLVWRLAPSDPDLVDALDRLSPDHVVPRRNTPGLDVDTGTGSAVDRIGLWAMKNLPGGAWAHTPRKDLAILQISTWEEIKYQSAMPDPDIVMEVSARQFEWRVRYPSSQRFEQWMKNRNDPEVEKDYRSFPKFHQKSDVHVVNEVHVIKNNPVIVHLTSRDVLHSFNVPHLRVKQDALPGKMIPVWFTPTKSNVKLDSKLGIYVDGYNPETKKMDEHHIWDLACAELCGWGHYKMRGSVTVYDSQADFDRWLGEAQQAQSADRLAVAANAQPMMGD